MIKGEFDGKKWKKGKNGIMVVMARYKYILLILLHPLGMLEFTKGGIIYSRAPDNFLK